MKEKDFTVNGLLINELANITNDGNKNETVDNIKNKIILIAEHLENFDKDEQIKWFGLLHILNAHKKLIESIPEQNFN